MLYKFENAPILLYTNNTADNPVLPTGAFQYEVTLLGHFWDILDIITSDLPDR